MAAMSSTSLGADRTAESIAWGAAAREYALQNFSVQAFAAQFQSVLRDVVPTA
jgi:hypothetical protein